MGFCGRECEQAKKTVIATMPDVHLPPSLLLNGVNSHLLHLSFPRVSTPRCVKSYKLELQAST